MSNPAKILLVEDNDFVRTQIKMFLTGAGYEVLEATDGRDALEVDFETVDMMIVDLRMNPMNGFEFVERLRYEGIEVPFIIVTGDKSPDILQKADKEGAGAVLMKPVQQDRLLKMVDRMLMSLKKGAEK